MKRRYLVLSSGAVFEGYALGAEGEGLGELVFTTNMCGYPETLTDPSYAGQIILQTFPLIGNYGIIPEDFEGECRARGYVVREACEAPSNFRCQMTLDAFLKERGVPAIMGVDTREITRILREEGVMNALICDACPPTFPTCAPTPSMARWRRRACGKSRNPPAKTRASAWRFWTTGPSTTSSANSTGAAAT